MLELKKGCAVPKCRALKEEYSVADDYITANVNTSKIADVIKHFIDMQDEELFFILELPATLDEEEKLRKSDEDPFHKGVYYIDGLSKEEANSIMTEYGELLINDGMCQFGFGIRSFSLK